MTVSLWCSAEFPFWVRASHDFPGRD